jgi:hypothetical protein
MREKEYLYVGYYYDVDGNKILKIGTTHDLAERRRQHNRNYKSAKNHPMPEENSFEYIWSLKLSRYNTRRYEDNNIDYWKELGIGEYIRNDRFMIAETLPEVEVKIRNIYKIALI